MAEMRMHANRVLRPRVLSSGQRRGLANYFAFTHGAYPAWWRPDAVSCAGEILGVYENQPSSAIDALVLTSEEVVILSKSGPVHVRYDAIDKIERLQKEPVSEAVVVHLYSGETISIPAYTPLGGTFTIVQFLLSAKHEVSQRRSP
jgi:hypothetical protein